MKTRKRVNKREKRVAGIVHGVMTVLWYWRGAPGAFAFDPASQRELLRVDGDGGFFYGLRLASAFSRKRFRRRTQTYAPTATPTTKTKHATAMPAIVASSISSP